MPNLTPGASWDGTTSWQSRAIPAAAPGLQGSGWPHKAIGAFNRAPHMWWDADFNVVVGAEHGDDEWIEEVTFWLEGNTATVNTVTKDTETGDIGFVVTIQPPSGTDGDAELYAIIKPVNGYQRRIGPLPVVLNKGGSISRQVRYISPSGDDDNGLGTQGAPWRSVHKACTAAPDGAIVETAAGPYPLSPYLEDDNTGTNNQNARLIEFRPASGLDPDDVWISRTSRVSPSGSCR